LDRELLEREGKSWKLEADFSEGDSQWHIKKVEVAPQTDGILMRSDWA
jgi:hypothetical protein